MSFISFSYLIAVDINFSTLLNRREKSRHPCLVPNLGQKAFSVSPLSKLDVGVVQIFFIFLKRLHIPDVVVKLTQHYLLNTSYVLGTVLGLDLVIKTCVMVPAFGEWKF